MSPSNSLCAFGEGEEIVVPIPVRVRLQIFVAGGAHANAHPGGLAAFLGVELVLVVLDVADHVVGGVFPPARPIWLRTTNRGDPLVRTIAIGLIDAVDTVIGHSRLTCP